MAGTLLLLFMLNWRLSLLVVVGYVAMFLLHQLLQRQAQQAPTTPASRPAWASWTATWRKWSTGQKVVKVFNHEQANMAGFAARNEKRGARKAGTGAQSYAATMIPAVVSISYINYAIMAVLGGIMVMRGWSDVGSLASYLVFVRQAALPINQFTQQGNFLLAALAGAERIFDGHGAAPPRSTRARWSWSTCGKRRRHPDRMRRKDRPLGLA